MGSCEASKSISMLELARLRLTFRVRVVCVVGSHHSNEREPEQVQVQVQVQELIIFMLFDRRRCLLIVSPPLTLVIALLLIRSTYQLINTNQREVSQPQVRAAQEAPVPEASKTEHQEASSKQNRTEQQEAISSLVGSRKRQTNSFIVADTRTLLEGGRSGSPGAKSPTSSRRPTSEAPEAQQHQQQPRSELEISILLDAHNYILYTRCSHMVHLQIERKSGRAQLSSRMLVYAPRSNKWPERKRRKSRQSDRMKLLSTVITIENDRRTLRRRASEEPDQWESDNEPMGPVKLRSNLTELYICFDETGKLEAKVSTHSA